MRARTAKTFALVALLIALIFGVRWLADVRESVRAKRTSGDMRALSMILRAENPTALDTHSLQRMLSTQGYPDYTRDAWGHPLQIERATSATPSFVLRSLGRDGRRGDCCRRWLVDKDWDGDAVLKDDSWLQLW